MTLPGVDLPEEVVGQLGYDLLSAAALRRMVQPHAAALGLDADDPQLLPQFDACLATAVSSPHRALHPAAIAQDLAHAYGQRLGWLLLALKRGDPANRAARPDWDDRHWSWWASIKTIWLGGGIVSGHLGEIAAQAAQEIVQGAGFPDFSVQKSPFAQDLPLYGLARMGPAGADTALLFDFGHTQVKRAAVQYRSSGSPLVTMLPPRPAPCEEYAYTNWPSALASQVFSGMLAILAGTWHEVPDASPIFLVSIATYLYNGHPYPTQANTGCYSRLQVLCTNLERFLKESVSIRIGEPVTLRLVHDGAAAAAAYTGETHAAVIILGTSLGIGFPPTNHNLIEQLN